MHGVLRCAYAAAADNPVPLPTASREERKAPEFACQRVEEALPRHDQLPRDPDGSLGPRSHCLACRLAKEVSNVNLHWLAGVSAQDSRPI